MYVMTDTGEAGQFMEVLGKRLKPDMQKLQTLKG